MDETLRITLPLPPRALSPNSRVHWGTRSRAVKSYGELAWCATKAAMHGYRRGVGGWDGGSIRVRAFFRTRRRPDPDNLCASLKSAVDGIVSAGLFTDDRDVVLIPELEEWGVDGKNPRVELAISRKQ